MSQVLWLICTNSFVCRKCGKANSITLPLKASKPIDRRLISFALKSQPLRCKNQDCGEPLPSTDDWEMVEATSSEAAVFESNPKSLGS